MKKNLLQKTIYTFLMLVIVAFAQAQLPPPPPPPGPQAGVPFDGAVLLLLGTGLIYGARKLYKEEEQGSEAN